MKRLIATLLTLFTLFAFVACVDGANDAQIESETQTITENKTFEYKLGVVDGAPSLAVANILDGFTYEYTENGTKYVYNTTVDLVNGAQNIRSGVLSGDYDMAIAPLNLASVFYNVKPELGIKLASVNIFGCLYVVGDNEVTDFSEFKGKTVISVGAGGTPDVIFRNLLAKNGVEINGEDENSEEKVTLTYADAASGVILAFNNGEADFALLGEPAVTTIAGKLNKKIALNLQNEWKKAYPEVNFVQAGLCVNNKVSSESKYIDALLAKMAENKTFIYEKADELKDIFAKAESTLKSTAFNADILDRCNIDCKKASTIKADVEAFLNAVKNYNAQQIGGKLPGEDFYL